MPPVANSEPSEVQQYAAASACLTRLLIWKPPSNYGRSSKKHANCYLFPYFLCAIATGNPYKIQQTTWNLAHQTEGGEYVKRDTLMKNDFKQTQLSPIPISNNRPPVSARGRGKHGSAGRKRISEWGERTTLFVVLSSEFEPAQQVRPTHAGQQSFICTFLTRHHESQPLPAASQDNTPTEWHPPWCCLLPSH